MRVKVWKYSNLLLTFVWLVMVPIAYFAGWIYSIAFISLVSIYANFASHLAAWRADEPDEQADRIEEILNQLLKNVSERRS